MSDSEEQKRKGLYDLGFTLEDPLESIYSNYDFSLPEDFNLDVGSLGANPDFGLNFDWDSISNFMADPQLFAAFAELNPEDAALLKDMMGGDYGFAPVGGGSPVDAASGEYDPNDQSAAETKRLQRQANATPEGDKTGIKSGVPIGDPNDPTGIKKLTSISEDKGLLDKGKDLIKNLTGLDDKTINELGKYGLLAGIAKLAYDDAERARQRARGWIAPGGAAKRSIVGPKGHIGYTKAASGGIMSLAGGGFTGTDEDYRNAYKPPAPDYGPPPPVTASPIANIGPGMYYSLQEPRPNLSYSEYLKALAKDPAFIKFKEDNPHAAAEFENMHPAVENRTFNPAKAFEPFYTREQISPDQKFDAATQTFFTPRKNWAGTKIDEYGRAGQEKQLENVYRQLDAMDQWNTTQAANAGRELLPAERMMAVGVKDDYSTSGPAVILHDPSKGRFIPAAETGKFMRGDSSASYEQAKNILPYEQAAAILGITNPFPSEKENEQILDYIEKKGVPSLLFTEYDRGTFLPSAYGLSPRLAAKREYELTNKVKPLDFLKKYLNLTPYQGPMPTIYQFPELTGYAEGGMTDKQPFYLGGITDGMTDEVPAHIDGKRPAALSDGEFVIPADVVSHLGNGNSNAGAQRLYEMMDQVRQARTGTAKQGKQINPEDFTKGVASFAGGGEVMDFRKLTPEQARQAWVEYGRTGEDPYGLAFDMMVGGKAANSLVNTGVNQLVNKNKQLRAADPTGYDVGNIVSNIVHKDFNKSQGTSSSLLPAHQQLQSYQKGTGLTDQQMINAMSKSPLRSGSTYLQNLNLLLGPDYSNLLKP
jgi:hypothetical protein